MSEVAVKHLEGSVFNFYQGTNPDTGKPWPKGEIRTYSKGTADYLVQEFPECFAVVGQEAHAAASGGPEVDRAMKPPATRKAAPKKATTKRKAPAKKPATKKAKS